MSFLNHPYHAHNAGVAPGQTTDLVKIITRQYDKNRLVKETGWADEAMTVRVWETTYTYAGQKLVRVEKAAYLGLAAVQEKYITAFYESTDPSGNPVIVEKSWVE